MYKPSLTEIAEETAKIREGWSDETRLSRTGVKPLPAITQVYSGSLFLGKNCGEV